MPKAGYCGECKKNVWLKEDGSCQFGHPASSISYTYETESQKTSQNKSFGQWFTKQTRLVKGLIIGGIAFLLLLCVALASLSNQEKKEAPQVEPESTYEEPTAPSDTTPPSEPGKKEKKEESLEYKLAVINAGGYVPEDDVTVTRFRYLLGEIDEKTTNSKQEIADMTVKGQQLLRDDYGKEVKLLDLMEAANKSIPPGSKMDYAEVMAALVILMKE